MTKAEFIEQAIYHAQRMVEICRTESMPLVEASYVEQVRRLREEHALLLSQERTEGVREVST